MYWGAGRSGARLARALSSELMAAYEATPWIPALPLGEYPWIEQILP